MSTVPDPDFEAVREAEAAADALKGQIAQVRMRVRDFKAALGGDPAIPGEDRSFDSASAKFE